MLASLLKHYPRLSTVFLSYIVAVLVFMTIGPDVFEEFLLPFGLIGVFIAGALYTYSFTASVGAILIVSIAGDYSPVTIAVVGGLGAVVSDTLIFKFVQTDLKKEVARIGRTPWFQALMRLPLIKARLARNLAGATVLASPLPDELGVAILASAKMKEENFTLVALIADMVGIYLLVSLGIGL